MRHPRAIRRSGAMLVAVLTCGCTDSVALAPTADPMPFDPSGSWEAQVQGLVSGSQVDAPMVITLSVLLAPRAPTNDLVELTGTWQWGGLGGIVDGFWHPFRDATAERDGCPVFNYCALGLALLPPPGSCPEVSERFGNTVDLWGWFNGSATIVGAWLIGNYWEVAGSEPCQGPTLMSLDTEASFARN